MNFVANTPLLSSIDDCFLILIHWLKVRIKLIVMLEVLPQNVIFIMTNDQPARIFTWML